MKITLIAFGTSVGGAIIFFILGHNLIQAHLFTIGAGWAIFSMGMAFGLALALAVLYFEILIRSFKQQIANPPQKKGANLGALFRVIGTTLYICQSPLMCSIMSRLLFTK